MLPKAQDDPTTVDQEISAAIAAHNADPDAHTAAGAALDLHRVNDVLDHPAGSVVYDKNDFSEIQYYENFNGGFSQYDPHGNVSGGAGYIDLISFHGSPSQSDATVNIPLFQNATFPSQLITVDFQALINYNPTNSSALINFGDNGGGGATCFGFLVESNTLKAFLTQDSGTTKIAVSGTPGVWAGFRIMISPADGLAYYYINSVQVAAIPLGTSTSPDLSTGLYIKVNSSGTGYSEVSIALLKAGFPRDLS